MMIGIGLGLGQTTRGSEAPASTFDQLAALLAGNSSAHDFTQATNTGTWVSDDLTALDNDFSQASASLQPGIDGTLGAVGDSTTELEYVIAGETYSIIFSATFDSTDTDQLHAVPGGVWLRFTSGNVSDALGFGGTLEIDGVATVSRGDAFTRGVTDSENVIAVHGTDLVTFVEVSLGRNSAGYTGSIRRCVVIDEDTVTGQDLTDARALAATWVAE